MSAPPVESRRRVGFGVFAECLLTGVWIALASVPVVTAPAAFAAGSRHLRRHLGQHLGGWREFVADLRIAARRGWLVGLAGIAACTAVWIDLRVARSGLPGGQLAAAVGVFALLAAAVTVLRAAAVWEPGARWRPLLAAAARRTVRAPAGSLLLVCGLAIVILCAGFLAPLAVPVLGILAAAAVAVEERAR
ncbi:hypothetical protein OKJ48_26545 [Streptomyces kunmingensis]|uniref:DUF624 domain-containing protein n=1 Tax=Streptomyces kunmingensis TaxID=68225 RepID=A0ABU6CIR2_9ACTN|nr:hypothetical protein [Streptomyces kunmingensis]MEB3963770.1 hypothetical protein [Streptomyces kunmingensis]